MPRGAILNIVVTGGAGFIGSNLCDRMIQRGHRVICLDNLLTGRISNVRPQRSLRRSGDSPAIRNLSRQRQYHRAARLLRRRQAIGRNHVFRLHRVHKVAIKVARIFNTYGPRMLENDGRVVSNFIVQALKEEPITLYGDGFTDALVLLHRRFAERLGAPDGEPGRGRRPVQSRQST
jgi:nucleoside-diphosphate-sugar epimerase